MWGLFIGSRCRKHRLTNAVDIEKSRRSFLTKCKFCSKIFRVSNNKKMVNKGKYCSRKCFLQAWENAVKRRCKFCNKILFIAKFRFLDGRGIFCSRKCKAKYMTKQIGLNTPHWKGIKLHLNRIRSSSMGKKWRKIERTGKCQRCGRLCNELIAHHIIPLLKLFLKFVKGDIHAPYDHNNLYFHRNKNRLKVCSRCHSELHPFISVLKTKRK